MRGLDGSVGCTYHGIIVRDNKAYDFAKRFECMKKRLRKFGLAVVALILFYIVAGWKIPVAWNMETLKLPKGCKTVHHTKIRITDVYWLHIEGEKVIKCDMGYEAVEAYIEEHNSAENLKYIKISWYGGMSSDPIYDAEYDEAFWEQEDRDDYVKICYFRKL